MLRPEGCEKYSRTTSPEVQCFRVSEELGHCCDTYTLRKLFRSYRFKSIIGGIGRNDNHEIQQKVFNEIYKALKPGGKLLFAENLIASPVHQRLRRRFVNWGGSWRYVSVKEMNAFLKDFSTCDIKTIGVLGTFGRNERQRKFLATMDVLIFNKVCPDNWKYISYGFAQK